jgi:hypothetical protein
MTEQKSFGSGPKEGLHLALSRSKPDFRFAEEAVWKRAARRELMIRRGWTPRMPMTRFRL